MRPRLAYGVGTVALGDTPFLVLLLSHIYFQLLVFALVWGMLGAALWGCCL